MSARSRSLASLAIAVWLCGCAASGSTQLPTFAANDPNAERANYQLHDPLPEHDTGPNTSGRPRGFDVSRSEPRRAVDKSLPTFPLTGRAPISAPPRSAQVVQP